MAWLLLFVPPLREAPVNRYDVLERNVVEHEDVWRVKVGGIVLDPFCGSGTTAAVAEKHGRRWLGIDVRPSQVDLTERRIAEVRGTAVEAGG